MPKKTKAQKMNPHRRPVEAQTATGPASVPGIGYFWSRKDGLRLLLTSELNADETVAVTLTCIDDRRDGVFKFQETQFDSAQDVATLMQDSPFEWIRGDIDQARKIVGIGARMNNFLGREFPEGFADFREKLGTGTKVQLPPGIFTCPVTDDPLAPELVEKIKESAASQTDVYFLSDRAQKKRNHGAKHGNYSVPMHNRLKRAFEESETLTLTPSGWNHLERALPTESTPEAIGLILVQDVLKGIAYALEKHIADATVPNPQLTDGQVIEALTHLKTALDEDKDLQAVEPFEVNFILEALDEAMALVKQIFREEVEKEPDKKALQAGVEWVLASVQRRSAKEPGKRAYISFVAEYV
ncbi:MAG: hypothetical protein K1Y36_14710 [Blastocatellia bacterium]|nr:hypothetical protein [Blastocatellia bacterium]